MFKRDSNGYISLGKWEFFIQALIVLSLIGFAFETLPGLSAEYRQALKLLETFSIIVFTVEFMLRAFFCKPKGKYIFSFMGIVDLVAIFPFYLGISLDLRSVRAFRLLRLFRLFKLVRYSRAIDLYKSAFKSIKEELILFGVTALIILYLASVGIYYFEHSAQPEAFTSIFSSMWWAIVTLTTVGYGDVYPITTGGRVFTTLILMVGLGIVAVPTGLFASALNKMKEK